MKEVILAGRPNSGKSTLFNRLATANQKVGNYAGCTVEKKTAVVASGEGNAFELTDLPGIYSLKPNSLDEEVAIRHLEENREKSEVVFVLDGNNLEQELVLPLMLKKRGFQLAVAVNMMDEVRANQKILNLAGMTDLAGIPFFPVAARTGEGIDRLKRYLAREKKFENQHSESAPIPEMHRKAREEARRLNALNQAPAKSLLLERDAKIDSWLLHKVLGPVVFTFVMFVLFQTVFTWAIPFSDGIEAGLAVVQDFVNANVGNELAASLISDGVLAGVGGVIVFVPQIALLFLLIGILEYSGYLPRIAFMVDRLMKPYGLDGKVFIPLLSSVACAVPGIMATRTIESERTRLFTIMVAPFMTCSARLPVYTLLIGAFVPSVAVGPFNLPGLVMFAMYAVGVAAALGVALILHKFDFQKRKHLIDFLHLPRYRLPNWPELLRFVWSRVYSFLRKAGTIIFAMAVLIWALLTFPRVESPEIAARMETAQAESTLSDEDRAARIEVLEAEQASFALERTLGGRLGKLLEPVFLPIGYDWKLTIGILSSLAAREVFVSTLGTVFALGSVDENSQSMTNMLRNSKTEAGAPRYTLATCLSLLLFFAFSLQCTSTIGVVRRETNSWKIPALMFGYMFLMAYGSAYLAYQVGLLLI